MSCARRLTRSSAFSELITSQAFGPLLQKKYMEFSRSILAAGHRMSGVVGDVLTITQLEAGRFELEWDNMDLCESAKAALAKFRASNETRGRDVNFETDVACLPIRADARAVDQMILKVLSNAAKFSDAGTPISVTVSLDKGAARLSISDKGIGMTVEEADAAIRPFRQADERLARKYEGSGLGLSIVNKLIDCHGGHLEIVSAVQQGTEVSLYFLAAPEDVGRWVAEKTESGTTEVAVALP
jgi:signal transduction histidine kinase